MVLARRTLPETRRGLLRARLESGSTVRAIECHNPLSAVLGASASSAGRTFDALWASGFANATALGLPDTELTLLERRLDGIADILSVTSLPIIVDADTGGDDLAFAHLSLRLEMLGVSAIIVEDKAGAKRTSLAAAVDHDMEDPLKFLSKIELAKSAMQSRDVLIFARIESLIAGIGLDDAIWRAETYLRGAADGIVIHSKDKSGSEILAFMERYRTLQTSLGLRKPLILIPTAYHHYTGTELFGLGASVVIHGNHMVRAAFRAMESAAKLILAHDRALEADEICAPVKHLFDAVGVDENSLPAADHPD